MDDADLPGIFPYLITGMVTASGGAWNASVFAEYANIQNRTVQTIGLGAQIDTATADGNFPILLLATILVALMVVTMNDLCGGGSIASRKRGINSKAKSANEQLRSGERMIRVGLIGFGWRAASFMRR